MALLSIAKKQDLFHFQTNEANSNSLIRLKTVHRADKSHRIRIDPVDRLRKALLQTFQQRVARSSLASLPVQFQKDVEESQIRLRFHLTTNLMMLLYA